MMTRTRGRSRWRRSLRERGSRGSARADHQHNQSTHTHITRVHAPRTRVGRDSLAHGQWPSAVHARRHEQAALQPLRRAPSSRHRPHSVHMQLLSRRSSSWPCAQSPTPSPPGRPAPRRASTHDALAARAATSTASEVRRRCNLLQARSARRPAAPTIRGESDGLLAPPAPAPPAAPPPRPPPRARRRRLQLDFVISVTV